MNNPQTLQPPKTPNAFLAAAIARRVDTPNMTYPRLRSSLARQCDITPRTLERYLKGTIDVRSSTVFALINALKLTQEELKELTELYRLQSQKSLISRKPIRSAK